MSKPAYFTIERVLLSLLLLGAAYFAVRLTQAYRHPGLELALGANGTVEAFLFREPSTDFLLGLRVVAVNGTPVHDTEDPTSLTRPGVNALRFEPADGSGTPVHTLWTFLRRFPAFVLGPDREVREVVGVRPDRLGLATGDRLYAIDGRHLEGAGAYHDLAAAQRGEVTHLTFDNPATPSRREVVVQRLDWRVHWTLFAVGIAFGLIGFAAFRLRPDTRSAWAFMLFAISCALFWFLRALPFSSKWPLESHLYLLLRCFMYVPMLYFLAVFTSLRRVVRRADWAAGLGALLGAGLYVGNLVVAPDWAHQGDLGREPTLAWISSILLVLLVSLIADLLLRLAPKDLPAIDRQRGRMLRIAWIFGILPVAVYAFVRISTGDRFAELRFWFELTVLLFPLILAYATVRHNLLQINELLLEGLVYGGLLVFASALYALAVAGVAPLVGLVVPGDPTWIKVVLVAALVLPAAPVHNFVRKRLDERFERSASGLETMLTDLEVSTVSVSSPRLFCEDFVIGLSHAIGSPDVSVLIRHPPTDGWWLAASTCVRGPGPTVEECSSFFRMLTDEQSELARDLLDEDLTATRTEDAVLRGMIALRAALAFPLIVNGELWGVLTVGEKSTLTNYSLGEVRMLRRIARECAVGLYQVHLRLSVIQSHLVEIGAIARSYPRCPEHIGSFEIERLLGEGAQALVYLGVRNGQHVAIKVANQRVQRDPKLSQRFRREREILAKLHHPNIVNIVEIGSEGQEPYLAVDYFPQGSLRDRLQRDGRLPEEEAVALAVDVARGLAAALEVGVVHRDVNPRNVLLDDGRACVGDFGIAAWEGEITITTHSQMLGTPGYMSPEVCAARPPDWRADQYGLGITLYEMLAGQRPYRAARVLEIVAMHLHSAIPDVRDLCPEVSGKTAAAIRRMMAKNPEERFGSYQELIGALLGS